MKLKPPRGWTGCKGIFVGGCIERGEGSSFRARAHAHSDPTDAYFGWICVRSAKRLGQYHLYPQQLVDIGMLNYQGFDGQIDKPSILLYHEYAHILTPKQCHTEAFRNMMVKLCGLLDIRKKGSFWRISRPYKPRRRDLK